MIMRRRRRRLSSKPDDLIVDTTKEERLDVFNRCRAISRYSVGFLIAASTLSVFLFVSCCLGPHLFSVPHIGIVVASAMGFIGIVNIICGLLLLAVE